ncbi:MAG: hypothetical protein LQ351_003750 [Letrouitia transgressa]|nr:MAG: hypothetical protein LQ351_003750 [Letrouitia transgressa]
MNPDLANSPLNTTSTNLRTRRPTPRGSTARPPEPTDGISSTPQIHLPLSSTSSTKDVYPAPGEDDSSLISSSRESQHRRPRQSARPRDSQNTPSTLATDIWGASWSSLQGIASTLLRSDNLSSERRLFGGRQQLRATHDHVTAVPSPQWGPTGNAAKELAKGSGEDRLAQLQVKRRETLLTANGHVGLDALGRYKRRDSDERHRSSLPPSDVEDRDVLVYLHKVKPEDTLAGVAIKYNCPPNVFRKANRLWPNDSIQIRKVVVLPVDACGVKGRKLTASEIPSLSLIECSSEDALQASKTTGRIWPGQKATPDALETPYSSIPSSPADSATIPQKPESDPPWKHDSWVMIDGFIDAVEIARLSRRTLGYFPPSRRRSLSYSDMPSSSLDLPRLSYQSSSPRREKSRSSSSNFTRQLRGPGGVGTMGEDARGPGPAQDGLNKLFAAHLPNVAPRSSFDSIRSNSSTGIENVGGAIEGWVRKMANKAVAGIQGSTATARSRAGDLIELAPAFEGSGAAQESGKGQDRSFGADPTASDELSLDDQQQMLRERFPPRGRVFGVSPRRNR